MKVGRFRWNIGTVMIAVAILAVLFAAFNVPAGILIAIAVLGPVVLEPFRRPFACSSWIMAVNPAILHASLIATWLAAWIVLKHPPRPSLDDPELISSFVDWPYTTTLWLAGMLPVSLTWTVSATALLASAPPNQTDQAIRKWRSWTLLLAWMMGWMLSLPLSPIWNWFFD